jgi:hypothetical protein
MPIFMSGGPLVENQANLASLMQSLPRGYTDAEIATHAIGVIAGRLCHCSPSEIGSRTYVFDRLSTICELTSKVGEKAGQEWSRWILVNWESLLKKPSLLGTNFPGPCRPNDTISRSWLKHLSISPNIFSGWEAYYLVD